MAHLKRLEFSRGGGTVRLAVANIREISVSRAQCHRSTFGPAQREPSRGTHRGCCQPRKLPKSGGIAGSVLDPAWLSILDALPRAPVMALVQEALAIKGTASPAYFFNRHGRHCPRPDRASAGWDGRSAYRGRPCGSPRFRNRRSDCHPPEMDDS